MLSKNKTYNKKSVEIFIVIYNSFQKKCFSIHTFGFLTKDEKVFQRFEYSFQTFGKTKIFLSKLSGNLPKYFHFSKILKQSFGVEKRDLKNILREKTVR